MPRAPLLNDSDGAAPPPCLLRRSKTCRPAERIIGPACDPHSLD